MEAKESNDLLALQNLFADFTQKLGELNEKDVSKLLDGNYELTLKVTRKKSTHTAYEVSKDELNSLIEEYNNCASREEGHQFLKEKVATKRMLEFFAKALNIMALKQDKVDVLRDKIVEATIGAKLRSNAIQGNTKAL